MNNTQTRLEKLERAISPETRQRTYISLSEEDFEKLQSGDLVVDRPGLKCYVLVSPDDWDQD